MKRALLVTVAAVSLAVAACGGDDDRKAAGDAATTTTSTVAVSNPSTTSTTIGGPAEYRSTVFQPAFTVQLPGGWTAVDRDKDAAQMWRRCGTCAHEGEEDGEITLDMGLAATPAAQAIERLRAGENLKAGAARPVAIAGRPATRSARRATGLRK